MKYSEINTVNLNAFGRINVISAFPGMGKTTATKILSSDTCFKAYDLDFAGFMKNPGVTDENWVELYIKHIQTAIATIGMKMTLAGPDSHTTYFLFVSSHEEVRKAMSEADIPFIYVLPSKEKGAQYLTENVIVPRAGSKDLGEQRAVAFAQKMVDAYKKNAVPDPVAYPNQFVIEVDYEIGDDKDNTRLVYLSDVVYTITRIPLEYRNSHTLPKHKMSMLKRKLCVELRDRNDRARFKRDPKGYVRDRITVSINSQGYLYMIWDGKRTTKPLRKFAKKNNLPDAVAERLANVGSDFIVLNRDDAENILDMLNSAIVRLESGTRQDNDVEVFGDKAISYERLIDELDHTVLPVSSGDDDEELADE
ncbi:MAG: hypothetical protein NC489_08690 [Ruminococcus flavefaciens]|nr:hypothetical protein [Ruminococcus flavefaciens]